MTKLDYTPILFGYETSVFSRKCRWYLTLRGLKYAQCDQPNMMPRPDLERLGIAYRRIPLLSIGRDIYIDSSLIIEKLEKLIPNSHLGSSSPYEQALERIMQSWINDGGPFWRTAGLIPPNVGMMMNPKWIEDRQEMLGRPFDRQAMADGRKDAYSHMKNNFSTIEHGLLADGRDYIFATEKPALVDIHTIMPFDWAIGESMQMGKHLNPDHISEYHYPRVYAWVKRFREAVDEAQEKTGPYVKMSSDDTINHILSAGYWEKERQVDELDPLKLQKGQMVQIYPSDTGFNHKDKGRLVWLDKREVVIESKVKDGNGYLRLHFPRHNFKIVPIADAS